MTVDLTRDDRDREMLTAGRRLFQDVLAHGTGEHSDDAAHLRDVLRAVGRAGWLVPAGPDAPVLERAAFFAAGGEALMPGLVSNAIAIGPLLALAGNGDRATGVERGECLVAVCSVTRGSAPYEPLNIARGTAGQHRVRGTCEMVEYGAVADLLVLLMHEADRARMALVLDLRHPGVERTPRSTFGDDFRADLHLDIEVPESDVLGNDRLGPGPVPEFMATRTAIRLMECGGAARAVTRRTVDYVNTRHQFGKPLAQFQAVKQHAADMLILSEGAFLMAVEALAERGAHGACAPLLWRAAAWVPRANKDVTLWAHQLHGGMGYARESGLFLWSERAKLREVEIESMLTPEIILSGLGKRTWPDAAAPTYRFSPVQRTL